ncbi:MAG: neutral/alkaline non-lysosomal ceramidase N-terminal domain-containing protein [Kiritimatiellia bacterium]
MKNSVLCFFVIMLFGTLAMYAQNKSTSNQNKVFKAGASLSNITPPLGMKTVGLWGSPEADYIHDQLHVRSLVLNDGEETLVFAIVDNVGVKREVFDAAKAIIQNKLKIPASNVLMAATHTHSAVSAGKQGMKIGGWQYGEPLDDYQRFLVKRIADGVQTALANLEPARIAWGSFDVPELVFNRRWIMKEPVWSPLGFKDKARGNTGIGHPDAARNAGPVDPEVSFIAVESLEGKPIAVLGNYSLHYVADTPKGHISANYFAVFGDRIQELLKADRQDPPFVGIMSNGTAGDVDYINLPGPSGERYPVYGKMRYLANELAGKVFDIYGGLKFQNWVPLGAAQSELTLEVRRASPELLANMEKVRKRPDTDAPLFHPLEKIYAERIRIHEKEWPDQIDIVLQVFRIGDLGITAVPFEVFAETGLEIKKKSPFQRTFNIELANGCYGYLPTPEQHELGGYETWLTTSKVETNATRKIVAELMALFGQVDQKNK